MRGNADRGNQSCIVNTKISSRTAVSGRYTVLLLGDWLPSSLIRPFLTLFERSATQSGAWAVFPSVPRSAAEGLQISVTLALPAPLGAIREVRAVISSDNQ